MVSWKVLEERQDGRGEASGVAAKAESGIEAVNRRSIVVGYQVPKRDAGGLLAMPGVWHSVQVVR